MQSPRRAVLFGLGVWAALVVVSLILLPFEGQDNALYESVKAAALAVITLGFAILYLRRVGESSLAEGGAIGLLWAAIVIALDLALYAAGAFTIGLGEYFADVASSYIVIPLIGTLVLGYLRRR